MSRQVYPLFAAIGVAAGLSVFALGRKVIADPGIRSVLALLPQVFHLKSVFDDPRLFCLFL